jgi:hypothetical protein
VTAPLAIRQCRRCGTLYAGTCATCIVNGQAIAAYNARCNDNAPRAPEPERSTREHATECGARRDVWKGWAR